MRPSLWASLVPRDPRERKPNHYVEMARVLSGEYVGRALLDAITPGNLEVHWPEGNVLLSRDEIDLLSREPDYNAVVRLERLPGPE